MALTKREMDGMMSTGDGEWCTPKNRFRQWDSVFHFAVDVGASKKNTLCSTYIGKKENALAPKTHWCKARGPAFCNPPYGFNIIHWVAKAAAESKHSKEAIVMLLPARTETEWFQRYVFGAAQLICFLDTRVKFENPKLNGKTSQPAFPSVLAVYYREPVAGTKHFNSIYFYETALKQFGCVVNMDPHQHCDA